MLHNRIRTTIFCAMASMLVTATALAAGYDTPMLYSARNMGMGGTAIGHTDDPSSIFHNPAGLARVDGLQLMGDASPLFGTIHGSPAAKHLNIDSNLTKAPFFLVGVGYRIWDKLVVGLGVYPIASAGAGYTYTDPGSNSTVDKTEDKTRLAFIEIAPSIAYEILPNLRFGVAYRASIVEFERTVITTSATSSFSVIDLNMIGNNYEGFRVGLQYQIKGLDIGLVYRNKITARVNDARKSSDPVPAVVIGQTIDNASFTFILPSKLGLGLHYRVSDAFRVALDFERAFNSDNYETEVSGNQVGNPDLVTVKNIAHWQDSLTTRVGVGYKMGDGEGRVGYVYDTQATNTLYPSAFGTPPGHTQVFTAGYGYKFNDYFDVSLAAAYRTGTGSAPAPDNKHCPFCGYAGDYSVTLFGAYFDIRYRFGGTGKAAAAVAAPVTEPTPPPTTEAAPSPAVPEKAPVPVEPAAPEAPK